MGYYKITRIPSKEEIERAKKARRKEKLHHFAVLCGLVMIFVGFWATVGFAGSLELDKITIGEAFANCAWSLPLFGCGVIITRYFYDE